MSPKYVVPSITETSFNCPHCGALAHQTWFKLFQAGIGDSKTPFRLTAEQIDRFEKDRDDSIPPEARKKWVEDMRRVLAGEIFLEKEQGRYLESRVENVHLSRCYNCDRLAVWISDGLAYPPTRTGDPPNDDLPKDVRLDYEEARSILSTSARGAAALLRLAIQKLCIHLGESGDNLNSDIACLVEKGLDPRVQRALDIVRVIGNESVHPGQIDLRDDHDTATELFRLVNLIAEIMITQPKHIETMYEGLPEGKRAAIEKRDGKVATRDLSQTPGETR